MKKTALGVFTLSAGAVAISICFLPSLFSSFPLTGGNIGYRIVLDSQNGGFTNGSYLSGAVVNSSAVTTSGNKISLSGQNVMKKTNFLAQMKASAGNFHNENAITGIDSFTITFNSSKTGTANLYFGTEADPSSNETVVSPKVGDSTFTYSIAKGDLPSGISYFGVKNQGGNALYVKSIEIAYSCTLGPAVLRSVSISETKDIYYVGETYSDPAVSGLKVNALYSDGTSKPLSYDAAGVLGYSLKGYNANLDEIDGSTPFLAKDKGEAIFTAVYEGKESTDSVTIFVATRGEEIVETSITLNEENVLLSIGNTHQIVTSILPAYASDKSLTYASEDSKVATVSDTGLVTGVALGKTNIIVTSKHGLTKKLAVTVDDDPGYSKETVKYTSKRLDSDYAPSSGEQKFLMIPISLAGSPSYSWTASKWNNCLSYLSDIQTYYRRASNGRLTFTGTLAGSYTNTYQSSKTETNLNGSENMSLLYTILDEAVTWAGSSTGGGINLDNFDTDDDGYIDSVHFIFNGSDNNVWGGLLWPHMNIIGRTAGTKSSPKANCYSATNLGHFSSAVTTIHEQGHIFGLEDYYDYSQSQSNYFDLIGGADMQDMNMFDWNPFSKLSMGWIDPIVVNGKKKVSEITIQPASTSGDSLIIPSSWNGTAFDEYIILELFTPNENNMVDWSTWSNSKANLGSYGVRLYHVDARLWGYNSSATFNYGSFVDDVTTSNYAFHQIAANNSSTEEYATSRPSSMPSNNYLLQLIQASNSNTFGSLSGNKTLSAKDLFKQGDTFTIGSYAGYTDYGPNFFANHTTFNNGDTFPYALKFTSMSATSCTIEVTKK